MLKLKRSRHNNKFNGCGKERKVLQSWKKIIHRLEPLVQARRWSLKGNLAYTALLVKSKMYIIFIFP